MSDTTTSDAGAPTTHPADSSADSAGGAKDGLDTAPASEIKPGLHFDLPEADYHGHTGSLSVSGAKVLLKAPALYQWQREHPVYKDVFDFGSAAHAKVLGVGSPIVVHEYDADKVKSPKATNAWKAEQAEVRESGGVLLLPEEFARVEAMAAKLREHPLANRILTEGEAEVSAFCDDDATQVLRRSRFDWHESSGILADYKTTVCAEPGAFARSAATFGYHMQAAWYLDIAIDLDLSPRGFLFIAQEKEPPYLVSVTELVGDALDVGRARNRAALERFRDCTESGIWPGYSPDITPIDLPRWAYYDQESA